MMQGQGVWHQKNNGSLYWKTLLKKSRRFYTIQHHKVSHAKQNGYSLLLFSQFFQNATLSISLKDWYRLSWELFCTCLPIDTGNLGLTICYSPTQVNHLAPKALFFFFPYSQIVGVTEKIARLLLRCIIMRCMVCPILVLTQYI